MPKHNCSCDNDIVPSAANDNGVNMEMMTVKINVMRYSENGLKMIQMSYHVLIYFSGNYFCLIECSYQKPLKLLIVLAVMNKQNQK